MTWTPEMAEAAAKYIQTMTSSASRHQLHELSVSQSGVWQPPVPGAPEPLPPVKDTEEASGLPPSLSIVDQLHRKGMDLDIDAGVGAGTDDDMPLRDALKEAMVRLSLIHI